jgi:hypothetical protein
LNFVKNLFGLSNEKDFSNLKQVDSIDGKNFKEFHIHIMNIKGWPRGIHHFCSKEHLQDYLNGYHFRYKRRSNMDTIFDVLIRKMVNYKEIPIKSITNECDKAPIPIK